MKTVRTPYPKVTELFCRVPLTGVSQHALGFSPRGTCVGSQYEHKEFISILFSRTQEIGQTRLKRQAIPTFFHFSALSISMELYS